MLHRRVFHRQSTEFGGGRGSSGDIDYNTRSEQRPHTQRQKQPATGGKGYNTSCFQALARMISSSGRSLQGAATWHHTQLATSSRTPPPKTSIRHASAGRFQPSIPESGTLATSPASASPTEDGNPISVRHCNRAVRKMMRRDGPDPDRKPFGAELRSWTRPRRGCRRQPGGQ